MGNNSSQLDDLAIMFTQQLQRDSKHEHKMHFVRWVGKRAEYECVECHYTYQANR